MLHGTGVKDNHAQATMQTLHSQTWSVFPVIPLLLKTVDATVPNEIQGNADKLLQQCLL